VTTVTSTGQYIHLQDVKPTDNMYPVILPPEQDAEARKKLAALEQKTGKKPNILIFLMDDVGWMDPGFNGGGEAVGNATPVMDRLANAGLIFTSAYSTPSSSPSRATLMTGQNPLHHGILIPAMYGGRAVLTAQSQLPRCSRSRAMLPKVWASGTLARTSHRCRRMSASMIMSVS
jgi:hypothetical protein